MAFDPTKIHFGAAVHEVIRRRGMTIEEASKKAKIQHTLISKWKGGRWQVIPEKTLEAVIDAVAETREDREQMAAAYAYDMLPGSSKGALRVVKIDAMAKKADIRGLTGTWNVETRQKLQAIGDAVQHDEDIRQMFDSLAAISKRANEKREGK